MEKSDLSVIIEKFLKSLDNSEFDELFDSLEKFKVIKINPKLITEGKNLAKSFRTKNKKDKQAFLNNQEKFKKTILTLHKLEIELRLLKTKSKIDATRYDNFDTLTAFCDGVLIGNIYFGIQMVLLSTKETINIYRKKLDDYRNKKGKQWREELYILATEEYSTNKILDKKKALETAFEKLPDKEKHKEEYIEKFDSIYRSFLKFEPFKMLDALIENPFFKILFERAKNRWL